MKFKGFSFGQISYPYSYPYLEGCFIAVTDSTDGRAAHGLRGTRTAANGAFRKALQGFRTAFPEEIVDPAVTTTTQKACVQCADAFLADVDEEDPGIRSSLEACVGETIATLVAGVG